MNPNQDRSKSQIIFGKTTVEDDLFEENVDDSGYDENIESSTDSEQEKMPEFSPKTSTLLLSGYSPKSSGRNIHEAIANKTYGKLKKTVTHEVIENIFKKTDIQEVTDLPKTEWINHAMRRNPAVLEMKERSRFFSKLESFSILSQTAKTENPTLLSKSQTLQMILEYLSLLGFKKTVLSICQESGINYQLPYLKNNYLEKMLILGAPSIEDFFQIVSGINIPQNEPQTKGEDIEVEINEFMIGNDQKTDDKSIWEEGEDSDENILFLDPNDKQSQIRAATLNKLVEKLTDPEQYNEKFLNYFLLTYQSFTTTHFFLKKLIERYHVPSHFDPNFRRLVQMRVIIVLKNWIENYFADFDQKSLHEISLFIDNSLARDKHIDLAKGLRNLVFKKLSGNQSSKLIRVELEPPLIPRNLFSPKLSLDDIKKQEIAKQLTLIEFEIFSKIESKELLNQAWNKPKLKYRSPNVLKLIDRFNELSIWIAQTVITTESTKERVRTITKFIKIADHLLRMKNYNTMMAVIAGLNNSAIYRLTETWKLVPEKRTASFKEFLDLMASTGSYKKYRTTLQSSTPPCLPYLGIVLTDLTFTEDGNPDFIQNLINFQKRRLVCEKILEIQNFQLIPYGFQPVHQIMSLLRGFPKLWTEDAMYSKSLEIQPRKK